jgi:hypothetical protein
VVLVFSILSTWAAHLNLCDFINFTMFSCFISRLSSSFVLILHEPSDFVLARKSFLIFFFQKYLIYSILSSAIIFYC